MKGSLIETLKELRSEFSEEEAYSDFVKKIENIVVQHEIEASEKAEAFPHSIDLLNSLKSKGKNIGIVTRNNKAASINTLKVTGLIEYMDVIITREDVEKVKPDPKHIEVAMKHLEKKAKDTVVIGDHRYDVLAGKRAGCFTIGVLSGVSSEDLLNDADLIVTSLEEIISFL